MGLHPNLTVEAVVNNLKVNVTVGKDSNGMAKVVDMKSESLKKVTVHFLGQFGNFDPMANSFESDLINEGNPLAKEVFDLISKGVFARVFKQYKYPNN